MDAENNYNFRLTKGPYAANVYLMQNDTYCCQLTLDWSYDGVYFKFFNDDWITLSIGDKTITHDIDKLDTPNKIRIFKELSSHFLNNLQNYSENSDASLANLQALPI